ncbi:patatin-like phospholipase family protein, partial [Frankia sp. CiP3]|uniref:patatin-like phospholipase family protein n=1 Tax=Frankia sp. CiP3 TaxID=2880971 RepID=UPI0021047E89
MNGGVSLAVWMGGVVHEIDLLRRASRGDTRETVALADRPAFDIWRRLTSEASKKVRVDVISGSSAGGLNALLLATGIGRGTPVDKLGTLWRKSASLSRLQVNKSRNAGDHEESFLSSDAFSETITEALKGIGNAGPSKESVTLFLTATSIDGPPKKAQDGFGQQFEVNDHRRLYRFENQPHGWRYARYKHFQKSTWAFRQESSDDFSFSNNEALSLAGLATASYPGAFSPVNEQKMLQHRHPRGRYTASCVMDGGVLNNAPFEPVLDEIAKRRVHEIPVDRVLVYIVPSAGQSDRRAPNQCACGKHSPFEAIAEAMTHPREVDLRSSIEEVANKLKNTGRDVCEEQFGRLVQNSCKKNIPGLRSFVRPGKDLDRERSAAQGLLGAYRYSRVRAVIREIVEQLDPELMMNLAAPRETETQAIDGILADDSAKWFPSDRAEELSSPDLSNWRWGLVTAERALQTFVHHLQNILRPPEGVNPGLGPQLQEDIMQRAACINDMLRKVQAVSDAIRYELKSRRTDGMGEQRAAALLGRVYEDLNIPATVGGLVRDSAILLLQALNLSNYKPKWKTPEDVVSAYLTVEVLTLSFAPPHRVVESLTPKFKFLRLGPDCMGPLFNEDRLVRLRDRKLYGIQAAHFGAFVDKEWRRSD